MVLKKQLLWLLVRNVCTKLGIIHKVKSTIPFAFEPSMKQIDVNELTPIQRKVLMAIKENPLFTIKELALYCQLGTTRIGEVIKELKKKEKLYVKGQEKEVIGM